MVTEGALPSLLRLIDSTLWSVDPFGHTGDEHMALLLGHPVVVLRAVLRLDIDPALSASDAATRAVPVRLGALAAWQDGLLGFYVGDDTSLVHPASPATPPLARPVGPGQGYLGEITSVPAFHQSFATDLQPGQTPRSPVTHPYVAPDATIRVWPSRPVALTLLVAPHASEYFALGLSWLEGLGARVMNRPCGTGMCGPWRSAGQWRWLARSVGLPISRHRSDDAGGDGDPVGGSSDGWALLVGDEVLGADLPPATAAALRRLRAASGLDLFEVRLDTSPADGPVFAEVPFLARLHRYGDDAVAAVQDALVRRGREQA